MLWKELPNQDTSKTWLFFIQNFAKTPNALVYLYITDGDAPTSSDQPQQILIALQVLRIYIQPGFKVYFAEENGGICTYVKTEKIPFVNYDVPTYHKDIPLTQAYRFTAPEGSEIVFQNLSAEGDCFINVGGGEDAWIRATKYATLIDSYHDDTEIVIKGETGSEVISIIQKQSLAVTQLSDENLALIEDLLTRVELIEENYVNQSQLDEVRKRTYYGIWSPYSEVTKSASNNIQSKTFKSQVDLYRSALYSANRILKVVNIFDFTYNANNIVTSTSGYLSFDLCISDKANDSCLNIYTNNLFIKENLQAIRLDRNAETTELALTFIFKDTIESIKCKTTIRSEEISSEIIDTPLTVGLTTLYNVDLYNGGIIFTDNEFFLHLLEKFEIFTIPSYSLSKYPISRGETIVRNSPIDNYNVHIIQDGECSIKYYEPFEPTRYEPYIEINIPKDTTVKSIIGFMLTPKEEYISDISAISLNLASALSEKQTQTSAGSTLQVRFPLYVSATKGISYLNAYKSISLDYLNKSVLSLIVQKVGD